jgi:hypothetical protein
MEVLHRLNGGGLYYRPGEARRSPVLHGLESGSSMRTKFESREPRAAFTVTLLELASSTKVKYTCWERGVLAIAKRGDIRRDSTKLKSVEVQWCLRLGEQRCAKLDIQEIWQLRSAARRTRVRFESDLYSNPKNKLNILTCRIVRRK